MDEIRNDINYPLTVPTSSPFFTADSEIEQVWKHFYHLGQLFAESKDMVRSLNCFIDVFLIRGKEMQSEDKDWLDFFRRQFAIYLMGKKRIFCSLCEGDMIHDFLKMEYEEIKEELEQSEIPFHTENLAAWFDSLELDFPWLAAECESNWSVG